MTWNPIPPTWKRIASNDDGRLIYLNGAMSVFGPILAVVAVSGVSGTTQELVRRWPDDQSPLIGGLVFSLLLLAVALRVLVTRKMLIDKSKCELRRTWRWLLWRGEQSYDLAKYTSLFVVPDQSIWPGAHDR